MKGPPSYFALSQKGLFCAYLHLYQVLKPTLKNRNLLQWAAGDCSRVPDSGVSGELSKCQRKKPNQYLCASVINSEKTARSNGKSWFCHLRNPSSLQKNLPFTLFSHQVPITTPTVKTANTVLPALLCTVVLAGCWSLLADPVLQITWE